MGENHYLPRYRRAIKNKFCFISLYFMNLKSVHSSTHSATIYWAPSALWCNQRMRSLLRGTRWVLARRRPLPTVVCSLAVPLGCDLPLPVSLLGLLLTHLSLPTMSLRLLSKTIPSILNNILENINFPWCLERAQNFLSYWALSGDPGPVRAPPLLSWMARLWAGSVSLRRGMYRFMAGCAH